MKSRMALFILLHALIAVLWLFIYSSIASVSINAFILHPLVVSALYVSLLFFSPRNLVVSLATLTTMLLLLLYLLNYIAALYWNEVISWSFLTINSSVIINELKKFPIYLLLIPLGQIFIIYQLYRKWLSSHSHTRQHLGMFSFIPVLMVTFYFITDEILEDMSEIWQTEPLFEFINARQLKSTRNQNIIIPDLTQDQSEKLAVSHRPNIFLIHGDALRADRLGTYGNPRKTSPFIDSLVNSKGGVKIPYSMSNCSESICGVSSVTTSSFSYFNHAPNLFNILKNEGYLVHFIGTGDLFHGGLDRYLDPITDNFLRADLNDNYYKHDDRFVLDTLKAYPKSSKRPNLFYLRMMSSHKVGTHLEKYQRYLPVSKNLLSMLMGGSTQEARFNDHDNFAIQFDAYVREIFSTLGEKHYLDHAIVVIFADHGEALGERGSYGHYRSIYQEEIHVPIIFWASENIDLGIKTNLFATLMDIPATLLHQLELPIPEAFLGSPLQVQQSEKTAYLNNERGTIGVLYQKNSQVFKLMATKKTLDNRLLYELTSDPDERVDLHLSQQEITEKMIESSKQIFN